MNEHIELAAANLINSIAVAMRRDGYRDDVSASLMFLSGSLKSGIQLSPDFMDAFKSEAKRQLAICQELIER